MGILSFKTSFMERNRESELMDDPQIPEEILKEVLRDIGRANRMLGGNKITLRAVKDLVKEHQKELYTILDIGCGDGAMLRQLARQFRVLGVKANYVGWDNNQKTLNLATELSGNFPEISYKQVDVLQDCDTSECFDFVLSTLTLHHFSNEQLPTLLKTMVKLADRAVVINDLQRSRLAHILFRGFSAIFIRTAVAKHDGLRSIESGFTHKELKAFSDHLNADYRIKWKWAFRYLWVLKK